jgi:hypothetical protein
LEEKLSARKTRRQNPVLNSPPDIKERCSLHEFSGMLRGFWVIELTGDYLAPFSDHAMAEFVISIDGSVKTLHLLRCYKI